MLGACALVFINATCHKYQLRIEHEMKGYCETINIATLNEGTNLFSVTKITQC